MNTRKKIDTTATTTTPQDKDVSSAARDEVLKRIEKDYEEFKETHGSVTRHMLNLIQLEQPF
jgi:hypothetical protein